MSCHSIGHGINSISNTVLDLYEAGKIDKDSAAVILHACRKGVNWCDGNGYEAVECLEERGYCGLCLEKSEELSNVFDNDLPSPDTYNVFRKYDKTAAHYYLCPECKKKVIEEFLGNKKNAAEQTIR
ncbi:MAG: hypothetical protein IJI14_05035 [Anaerolineaceae bacterium]|nr:hypothetical protein [Anaerolineaceae bacterium]